MGLEQFSTSIESLGYVAGTLTTIAFVPQVLKTWRTRSSEDLSAIMLTVFTIGIVMWLVYGLALRAWPIVIANIVTLALTTLLLVLKLKHVAASSVQ